MDAINVWLKMVRSEDAQKCTVTTRVNHIAKKRLLNSQKRTWLLLKTVLYGLMDATLARSKTGKSVDAQEWLVEIVKTNHIANIK